MSNFYREVTATIVDGKLFYVSTFNRSTISYLDFDLVWKRWKNGKFQTLTIIHTHPDGFAEMSEMDKNTIKGWALALGIPIVFLVVSRNMLLGLEVVKYVVKLRNNVPITFYSNTTFIQDKNFSLLNFDSGDKFINLLDKCSRDNWLKDYYLFKLLNKVNLNIDLDKRLL